MNWLEGKKTYITAGLSFISLLAAKFGFNFDFNGLDNEIFSLINILLAIASRRVAKPTA